MHAAPTQTTMRRGGPAARGRLPATPARTSSSERHGPRSGCTTRTPPHPHRRGGVSREDRVHPHQPDDDRCSEAHGNQPPHRVRQPQAQRGQADHPVQPTVRTIPPHRNPRGSPASGTATARGQAPQEGRSGRRRRRSTRDRVHPALRPGHLADLRARVRAAVRVRDLHPRLPITHPERAARPPAVHSCPRAVTPRLRSRLDPQPRHRRSPTCRDQLQQPVRGHRRRLRRLRHPRPHRPPSRTRTRCVHRHVLGAAANRAARVRPHAQPPLPDGRQRGRRGRHRYRPGQLRRLHQRRVRPG
ncbi:hypothetical protein FF38_12302, partial [Lucilia cuprina]